MESLFVYGIGTWPSQFSYSGNYWWLMAEGAGRHSTRGQFMTFSQQIVDLFLR